MSNVALSFPKSGHNAFDCRHSSDTRKPKLFPTAQHLTRNRAQSSFPYLQKLSLHKSSTYPAPLPILLPEIKPQPHHQHLHSPTDLDQSPTYRRSTRRRQRTARVSSRRLLPAKVCWTTLMEEAKALQMTKAMKI